MSLEDSTERMSSLVWVILVFLKFRPHSQRFVEAHISAKLAPRYYGPFQVVELIGAVPYKLQLPTLLASTQCLTFLY